MIVLTHNDLDAVGCELCIRKVINVDKVFYEDYITIRNTVNEIISYSRYTGEKSIIIADLSFAENPDLLQGLVNHFETVIHIDHHSYPDDFKVTPKPNGTFRQIIDQSRCACKICYDSFKLNDPYLRDLIDVIDKFDRFVVDDPKFKQSIEMNNYFWKFGYQHFFELFKNSYPDDYNKEIQKINEETLNGINKQKKEGLILDNKSTTIQFGMECFIESQLDAFARGQKGYICVTKNTLKVRLNQKAFATEEACDLRLKIAHEVTGHPYAFTFRTPPSQEELYREIQRICEAIESYK